MWEKATVTSSLCGLGWHHWLCLFDPHPSYVCLSDPVDLTAGSRKVWEMLTSAPQRLLQCVYPK